MPKVISNRSFTLSTTKGHTIRFTKDEPREIPGVILEEAIQAGCVLAEGEISSPPEPAVEAEAPVVEEEPEAITVGDEAVAEVTTPDDSESTYT